MSSLVFPTSSALPGFAIKVRRDPDYGVKVQESISRKENRFTYETYPLTHYTVDFNFLRTTAAYKELQQLATHIARHFGKLDSFLLPDPEDKTVTDHGFAVGDGTTASFQLQRTLGGDLIDAAGFEYQARTKPYTNLIKNSSFETDSNADGLADSWAVYNSASATEPTVATIIPGMNGGKAQRVSWGIASTTWAKGLNTTTVPGWVAGQFYTLSFFARASSGLAGGVMGPNWNNAPSTQTTIANPALTGAWQRYVFQFRWNIGATVEPSALYLSIQTFGTFGDLDFDLVQVVAGQHVASEFQPIETPAAATGTRTPSYWPGYADGYEPIFDLNGDSTFYEDGTWRGRRTLYPFTRANLLPWSEQFDNAGWTKTNITVTPNTTTAPDGTSTADTISEGVANAQHYLNQTPVPTEAQGELRCYSIFVKANNLPNIIWGRDVGSYIKFNLGTGVIDGLGGTQGNPVASGVITDPRWPGWYRIWFVARSPVTPTTNGYLFSCLDATYNTAAYTGTSRTFFAWGAMCERVSNLNGPTPYIQTPSSAAVTITDYTLSSSGLFTPASVPAAGTYFSWDGSFYRRVRIDADRIPMDRIVQFIWECKSLPLVTVKA